MGIQLSSFHNSFTKTENEDGNNYIIVETKKSVEWENMKVNWSYLIMITLLCGFSTMSLGGAMSGSTVAY